LYVGVYFVLCLIWKTGGGAVWRAEPHPPNEIYNLICQFWLLLCESGTEAEAFEFLLQPRERHYYYVLFIVVFILFFSLYDLFYIF